MIACVSSGKKYYEETLNTLKYSSLAGHIRNKSKRNIKEVKESDLKLMEQSCQQSQEGKLKNGGFMDVVSELALAL